MSMKGKADPGTVKYKKKMAELQEKTQARLFSYADDLIDVHNQYYDDNIAPLISGLSEQVDYAIDNFENLRTTAMDWAQTRENIFQTQGVEGINFFMDRVLGRDTSQYFDEEEYAATEARRAVGDIENQRQIASETFQRQLSARGVNPNSGQALAGLQMAGLNASLAKASAYDQARRVATQRGDSLATAAGNAGIQLSGLAAPYLAQAGTYTGMGVDVSNAQLQATSLGLQAKTGGLVAAGNIISPMNQQAMSGEGQAVQAIAQQKAQDAAGWGSLIGKVAGVGIGLATGNPLAVTKGLLA